MTNSRKIKDQSGVAHIILIAVVILVAAGGVTAWRVIEARKGGSGLSLLGGNKAEDTPSICDVDYGEIPEHKTVRPKFKNSITNDSFMGLSYRTSETWWLTGKFSETVRHELRASSKGSSGKPDFRYTFHADMGSLATTKSAQKASCLEELVDLDPNIKLVKREQQKERLVYHVNYTGKNSYYAVLIEGRRGEVTEWNPAYARMEFLSAKSATKADKFVKGTAASLQILEKAHGSLKGNYENSN